jgi:hypothetical protein
MKIIQLALALTLFGTLSFAATKPKTNWFRNPASSKLLLSKLSPDTQSLDNDEAFGFYKILNAGSNYENTSKKNLEEFILLGKSLEKRGYIEQQKPLHGHVFSSARHFSFYRKEDQNIQAMNDEEAYTSVRIEFNYDQLYLEKNWKPDGSQAVPSTRLTGNIYLRCPEKSTSDCPVAGITVNEAGIVWDLLPSDRRGANSSAGGANQK